MYEMAMMFGGHRMEDKQWLHVLRELAGHFGVKGAPEMERTLVDKKRQWKHFRNLRKNAALRSGVYMLGAPVRAATKPFKAARKPQ